MGRVLATKACADHALAVEQDALGDPAPGVAVTHGRAVVVEPQCGVESRDHLVPGRGAADRAKHHHAALTAGQAAVGRRKLAQQGPEARQHFAGVAGAHRDHGPRQFQLLDPHRGVLVLRLARHRIDRLRRQRVDAEATDERAAPVHRQENLTRTQIVRRLDPDADRAPTAGDPDAVAGTHAAPRHVLGVHRQHRFRRVRIQARHQAGPAHAMPLVAQAARGQMQRIVRVGRLGEPAMADSDEAGASVRRGEPTVAVQPFESARRTCRQRPLLRTRVLEAFVVEAGDVQIATARGFTMLVEDLRRPGIREQARRIRAPETMAEATPEIGEDLPVVACLAGRHDRAPRARDAPLGIGLGAILLAPGRRRQQHVGIGRGLGGRERFLHHHELGRLQRLAHSRLVRQRLRRVGAGDPDRLDAPLPQRLEHLDGGQSGS